jgi:hypothetical protein
MLLDMSFERDECLIDECCDFLIRVRLSFQLSTGASGGRGREINQQRFAFGFGLGQRRIYVAQPIN